jgi:hypothetical protein
MNDRRAADRRPDDCAAFAIFPVQNADFVETGNQFACTFLDIFIQLLNFSVAKRFC